MTFLPCTSSRFPSIHAELTCPRNRNRVSSITVILMGSMYYTWVKAQGAGGKAPPQAKRAQPEDDVEQGLLMQPRVSNDDADSSVTMFEVPDDDEPKCESR